LNNVAGKTTGYLYVTLGSGSDSSFATLFGWHGMERHLLHYALAALACAMAVMVALFAYMTIPLHRLSTMMQQLREQGFKDVQIPDVKEYGIFATCEVEQLHFSFADLMQNLCAQYQQIENDERMRRELLSHITHDLKTPLAALQGYLETWLLRPTVETNNDAREYIAIALRNAQQLNTLVDQLVVLARLEGGIETLKLEPVAIAELAQDVLSQFALRASDNKIELSVTPHDPSILVHADIGKLERVLCNLIDNAFRYTPNGGAIWVELVRSDIDHRVVINIHDTGSGIASEDIAFVFEPNFKGKHEGQVGHATHLGLGLSIVRRLLELHGTSITVRSELGQGAVFSFSLPLA
jgi:signal transduction histidine kinase